MLGALGCVQNSQEAPLQGWATPAGGVAPDVDAKASTTNLVL